VNLAPLSHEHHAALRLRPLASYDFARDSALVSLYASEVYRAAHEFPVTFSAEADGFFPAALLGLAPGQNLFVGAKGQWLSSYVPALWRRGPFRLAKVKEREEWVLCMDLDSPQLNANEGEPLFDAEGKPAPLVGKIMQFLVQLETDRAVTLAACSAMDRHGLLQPWDLQVQKTDGSTLKIDGLTKIDEGKLTALDGEALAELNQTGALALIYAHLFSLHKLPILGQLGGVHEQVAQQKKAIESGKLDLDRVFGIVEDDPFIF
jgi:hypothetical protein